MGWNVRAEAPLEPESLLGLGLEAAKSKKQQGRLQVMEREQT